MLTFPGSIKQYCALKKPSKLQLAAKIKNFGLDKRVIMVQLYQLTKLKFVTWQDVKLICDKYLD